MFRKCQSYEIKTTQNENFAKMILIFL